VSSGIRDTDRQVALWETLTHEVSQHAAVASPQTLTPRARDEAVLRELQAMIDADARGERDVPRRASSADPVAREHSIASARNIRQLTAGDRELVALLDAYERGVEGKAAAAAAGLRAEAHRAALRRLKRFCDQLRLLDEAGPTVH